MPELRLIDPEYTRADLIRVLHADGVGKAEIVRRLGCTFQAVNSALRPKSTRKRGHQPHPKCPHCGRPMPAQTLKDG